MKISHDVNGNKVVKISGADLGDKMLRGFSIQTSGNLPYTHRNDLHCTKTTQEEIFNYILAHGTPRQKQLLQTEEGFNLQNIKSQRMNYRNYWRQLTDKDIDSLVGVMGKGCRHETKKEIRSGLEYLHGLESSWVFERLVFDHGRWSYCAGQDYTFEMPQVRKVFA